MAIITPLDNTWCPTASSLAGDKRWVKRNYMSHIQYKSTQTWHLQDWVRFYTLLSSHSVSRSIQECQMGLGNDFKLKGRELGSWELCWNEGPGESGSRKFTLWPRNTRKHLFFFFFCRDLVEKMQNKTNFKSCKIKTPHLSYVGWETSWHILIVLESSRGKLVTSKWSQIRDTTQAPVRHKFKSPPRKRAHPPRHRTPTEE